MISPVTLYRMRAKGDGEQATDALVNQISAEYPWFLIVFLGQLIQDRDWTSLNKAGELGDKDVCLIHFTALDDDSQIYTYGGAWTNQAPGKMQSEIVQLYKDMSGDNATNELREVLERLFYGLLMPGGEQFQPSLVLIRRDTKEVVRRKLLAEKDDAAAVKLLLRKVIEEIRNGGDATFLASVLTPTGVAPASQPRQAADCKDVAAALYHFLDQSLDVAQDFAYSRLECEVSADELQRFNGCTSTTRFEKAYSKLDESDKKRIRNALNDLIDNPKKDGLGLEKLSADFWRCRASKRLRIHFSGTPKMPVLMNVGGHRLIEGGKAVG